MDVFAILSFSGQQYKKIPERHCLSGIYELLSLGVAVCSNHGAGWSHCYLLLDVFDVFDNLTVRHLYDVQAFLLAIDKLSGCVVTCYDISVG